MTLGHTVIRLVRGLHPAINNVTIMGDMYTSSYVTIARAGLFLVVSIHKHGIELLWDRGLRQAYAFSSLFEIWSTFTEISILQVPGSMLYWTRNTGTKFKDFVAITMGTLAMTL